MRNEFLDFYERERPLVEKFLIHLGADRSDATDATRQTFVEAWRLLGPPGHWERIENRGAWIRTVARRTLQQPRGPLRRPGPTPVPDDLSAQTLAVLGALDDLGDEDARAVIALDLDAVPSAEAADVLELSEPEVLDLRAKARGSLLRRLAPEPTDERLDALLRAADDDLLAHVLAADDPTSGLLAFMAEGTNPAVRALGGARGEAAKRVLALRAKAVGLACTLEFTHAVRSSLGEIPALHAFLSPDTARTFNRAKLSYVWQAGGYAFPVFRTLGREADIDSALNRERKRCVDLAIDLMRTVSAVPDEALAGSLDQPGALGGALDRARELAGNLNDALDHTLERASHTGADLAADLAESIERDADLVDARAARLGGRLVAELGRGLDPGLMVALELDDALAALAVDASGADLSACEIGAAFRALLGVVWTRRTSWPTGLDVRVARRSREIAHGIWQVVDGDEREAKEMITMLL